MANASPEIERDQIERMKVRVGEILAGVYPDDDGSVEMSATELIERLCELPALDHAAAVQAIVELIDEGKLSRHWIEGNSLIGFGGEVRHAMHEHFAGLPGSNVEPPGPFDYRVVRVKDFEWLRVTSVVIPPEHRTRPLGKEEAARYLGMKVAVLRDRIDEGKIHCEELSRQSFIFDVRAFPEAVHSNILPKRTGENSR